MGLKEGSVIPVNLYCGCCEVRVTLLHGKQAIKCPHCGKTTVVVIEINLKDEVSYFKVREAYA